MQVTIELPEDVADSLRDPRSDISRALLEAVAIEGYRSGRLSAGQVARMLGYGSRMKVDALLKEAGVYLDYSLEDLESDRETHRRLGL